MLVVGAFERSSDALADVASFDEDFLLADLEIVSGRVERLRESVKKGRPNRDQELAELAALEPFAGARSGPAAARCADERRTAQGDALVSAALTEKPKLVLVNVADDEAEPERFVDELAKRTPPVKALAVPAGLELELERMTPEDRAAFREEDGHRRLRPRRVVAHAHERFGPDALFHRRREGSAHLDAPPRRHGAGGGG